MLDIARNVDDPVAAAIVLGFVALALWFLAVRGRL